MQKAGTPADISIMRLRGARRRRLLVVLACLWLAGCAGGFPSGLPTGFINKTQHSDAELWAIWKTAQQELAQEVDLNPLQQSHCPRVARTNIRRRVIKRLLQWV